MKELLLLIKKTPFTLYVTYLLIYIPWGFGMDAFGSWVEIARFNNWWQVITCYGLYMIPISVLLKGRPFFEQYAYGFVAMGLLEFGGYYFKTSYAYPNNIIENFFGIRNFALGMALFFAVYFPLGNWVVGKLFLVIFPQQAQGYDK
ncbi:hypothetical protein ULMS_04860 [Patiriisocius marinistellae]|uniref:Uncharacterized protein n=1 Tax=Patiriisocius marinistellae TaxID=2494560 RepID=A0A5J4FUX0_9FLAO|nr:hypothetical protein [Patiriisocius marinistellae]GEQ84978.1 hypothetical protein ULMS_04860 [Patiriisocius marinistellae]